MQTHLSLSFFACDTVADHTFGFARQPPDCCSKHPWDRSYHYSPCQKELGSFTDVPGRTHRKDAFIATGEKHPFQKMGTLVVEEVFVPFVLYELRYHHDNVASGIFFREIENELNNGNDDEAVGRRQSMELRRLLAGRTEGLLNVAFPFLSQDFVVLGERNVQGDDFRGEPGCKFNSLAGDSAPAVDDDNGNGRLAETCNVNRVLASREHPDRVVVAADKHEDNNR